MYIYIYIHTHIYLSLLIILSYQIFTFIQHQLAYSMGIPVNGCQTVKNPSACNAGDQGSIPGSGRFYGEGNGNPLQYSCLETSGNRGAWWATVHGISKSWTQLSNTHTYTHTQLIQSDHFFIDFSQILSMSNKISAISNLSLLFN